MRLPWRRCKPQPSRDALPAWEARVEAQRQQLLDERRYVEAAEVAARLRAHRLRNHLVEIFDGALKGDQT